MLFFFLVSSEKNDFSDIPEGAWDILKDVNLFGSEKITPEQPADLMICSHYITLSEACGGDDDIKECGFKRKAPRWLGKGADLLTVGGEAIREEEKWSKIKGDLTRQEVRLAVARVVETAVLVCMSTHVYSFGGDLFL